MGVTWKQLPAFAMAQQHSQDLVMRLLGAETIEDKAAYMDEYQKKPIDLQCALGFMRCLIESSFAEPYSAYGRYCMELFERRRVPPMRLPLCFIGWAGPQNNIGPAYEIDPTCLSGVPSRIFYTDVDIRHDPEEAAWLAKYIAKESSGIEDVRAETLNSLYTLQGLEAEMVSGISFHLSESARKHMIVNHQEIESGEHGGAIFVLPKAGEFTCMLGEMLNDDPATCVILAKHMYCMK